MALSFLKDRDENSAVGNLGIFTGGGARSKSIQIALDVYRKDQKTHHEQSIASDLTRGLLRKVFRDTVLESSKQVKRKYSYSAVGSSVAEEANAANMGIMAKLKKMQKERLIVARLGFPDKAIEIDKCIEKIRADLRSEREKKDSKILEEALAAQAIKHEEKVAVLEMELKQDEEKVRNTFERERVAIQKKHERQFVGLVDDAIKRAIGKSKKYLCHHNKTASFNTRRPKKEVIHFRKNAKRLRHGGRLDESAAWEEKAAELDADHLDKWREEVAASLTASAWGGSSSALDQLASQHQREMSRMKMAQENEWTLMLMRHQTARRNCQNTIAVEIKKLRNSCKKRAEERHRREMVGENEPDEGEEPSSEDIQGMLRSAIDDEGCTAGEQGDEQAHEQPEGVVGTKRSPTRPSNAPPSRGRRPQPNNVNLTNEHSTQQVSVTNSRGGNDEGDRKRTADKDTHIHDDNHSFGQDSHDLQGFDELEEEDFSYDQYPAAGSPEEPVWIHTPWDGTNSGDIPVLDKVQVPVSSPASSPTSSFAGEGGNSSFLQSTQEGDDNAGSIGDLSYGLRNDTVEDEARRAHSLPRREQQDWDGGHGDNVVEEGVAETRETSTTLMHDLGKEDGGRDGRRSPRRVRGGVASPRAIADGRELKRYEWRADVVPGRPSLLSTSRIPTGNRADKIKSRNAKKKDKSRKNVSWGDNTEIPPESDDDFEDGDGHGCGDGSGNGGDIDIGDNHDRESKSNNSSDDEETDHDGVGSRESDENNPTNSDLDGVADGFVENDFLYSDDDDDDTPYPADKWRIRPTKGIALRNIDTEPPPELAEDSKRANVTAACVPGAREKGRASLPERDRELSFIEGLQSNDANNNNEIASSEDGNPGIGRQLQAIDPDVALVKRKRKAVSRQEASAPEEDIPLPEMAEYRPSCKEEDPLQRALDQFCLILALHGDWPTLLGQMLGSEACRNALHKWSRSHRCGREVDICLGADLVEGDNGLVSSRGSARAEAAVAVVAGASILASFIASPSAKRVVGCTKDGRKALGGSTIADEPALARSKRPWRTLFERTFGSLQYGAVLSLPARVATANGQRKGITFTDGGSEETEVVEAGRVLWANEGFEKLSGIDAVDIVGQNAVSLFEEEEHSDWGKGGELKRHLELFSSCILWMTMAGQRDHFTNVLCLHQPVAVPSDLGDEGRYSVLLFFDTASAHLETRNGGVRSVGGMVGRHGVSGNGEFVGSMVSPGEQPVAEADRVDLDLENIRQQACLDLAKAMASLLTNFAVDNENSAEEEKTGGALKRSNSDSLVAEVSMSGGGDGDPRLFHGRRVVEDGLAEEEPGHDRPGGQGGEIEGAFTTGRQQQGLSSLSRPAPMPRVPSSPPLALDPEYNIAHRDPEQDREGKLSAARSDSEFGVVVETDRGTGSFEATPFSDTLWKNSDKSVEEEAEERHYTGRSVQPLCAVATVAACDESAGYASSDKSSAEPRDDLLLPPRCDSTLAERAPKIDAEVFISNGDKGIGQACGKLHQDSSDNSRNAYMKDGTSACNPVEEVPVEEVTKGTHEMIRHPKAVMSKNEPESDDPYEDDFCEDEDEWESSPWSDEEDGGSKAMKDYNVVTENPPTATPGMSMEEDDDRCTIDGGNEGVLRNFDDDLDDSIYSGTVAGGLNVRKCVENEHEDKDEIAWGASSEGPASEEYNWSIS